MSDAKADVMCGDGVAAVKELGEAYQRIQTEIRKVIIGQDKVVEDVLVSLFCRGHALLIGVPGLAKTLLISTLARVPSVVLGGGASITSFGPYDNFSTNHNIFNNFTAALGRHTLKVGGQFFRYRKNENAAGANAGSFTFAGAPRPAGAPRLRRRSAPR